MRIVLHISVIFTARIGSKTKTVVNRNLLSWNYDYNDIYGNSFLSRELLAVSKGDFLNVCATSQSLEVS